MAENGSKNLTPAQARAVAALLSAESQAAAAVQAGVGARTLARWLSDDAAFQAALLSAETRLIDAATRRLLTLQSAAIDQIAMLMSADEAAPAVQLRAAMAIFDYVLKMRELRNIETRLSKLEEAIQNEQD